MPRPYDVHLPGFYGACAYCGSNERYIRDRGPNIGICCAKSHFTGSPMWLSADNFRPGGQHFGLLPPEDFDQRRRHRAKKFQIVEHLRVAILAEESCSFCRKPKFQLPRTESRVLDWIRAYHGGLYGRVLRHFNKGRQDEIALLPREWSGQIPEVLRDEILQEIEFSQIQCDHLVPVHLLELVEGSVPRAVLEFGGRRLAVPACQRCNRGRTRHIENPDYLLERWVAYKFDGNRRAAEQSPEWPWAWIELLVRRGAAIDRDILKLGGR